jgi:glycerol-3-phosphate dehydrogenase
VVARQGAPAASRRDIDYLLERVNEVLVTPLTHEDVEGVYAGLRPLLHGESDQTSKLSASTPSRTRCRGSSSSPAASTRPTGDGQDASTRPVRALDARVPPSVTEDVPLVGAEGFAALWNQRRALADRSGLHRARIEHLLGRHGSLVHEVWRCSSSAPSSPSRCPAPTTTCRSRWSTP